MSWARILTITFGVVFGLICLACGGAGDTTTSRVSGQERIRPRAEQTRRQRWRSEMEEARRIAEQEIQANVDMSDLSAPERRQLTEKGKVVYSGERIRLVTGRYPNGQIRFAVWQWRESASAHWNTYAPQQRCGMKRETHSSFLRTAPTS